MNHSEFVYSWIPGLEADLTGASEALKETFSEDESYERDLRLAFEDSGLEQEFVAWSNKQGLDKLPEAVRRELWLINIRE